MGEGVTEYYRYEDRFDGYYTTRVILLNYFEEKKTPKGVFVKSRGGWERRFILNKAKKKFAHKTRLNAAVSFFRRKKRQVAILEYQIIRAQSAYRQAKVLVEQLEKEVVRND